MSYKQGITTVIIILSPDILPTSGCNKFECPDELPPVQVPPRFRRLGNTLTTRLLNSPGIIERPCLKSIPQALLETEAGGQKREDSIRASSLAEATALPQLNSSPQPPPCLGSISHQLTCTGPSVPCRHGSMCVTSVTGMHQCLPACTIMDSAVMTTLSSHHLGGRGAT